MNQCTILKVWIEVANKLFQLCFCTNIETREPLCLTQLTSGPLGLIHFVASVVDGRTQLH